MRPALGVLRLPPCEAIRNGIWHLQCARQYFTPAMLKASLDGLYDPATLQDALKLAEAEAEKLKAVQT